jgi:hypothetical protein
MDAIFCGGCGAKLEEAPTLLPDQRLPCPTCGSLARQFEQDVTDQIARSDRGTATDTVTVTRTVGFEAVVYAEIAEATGTALAPDVGVGEGRGARIVRDHLVVVGQSLWWTQLTEEPAWMVQVVDEAGEVLATGVGTATIKALAEVAEFLLPGHPG